jgi:hypothetical protein
MVDVDMIKSIQTHNDSAREHNVAPRQWVNNNVAGFPKWMNTTFKEHGLQNKKEDNSEKPHQKLIKDYLQPNSPYRGLLLYHGLGVGKTRSAIGVAESLIISKQKIEALIVLPASLKNNFVDELKKFGDVFYKTQNTDGWKIYRIGNMTKQQIIDIKQIMSEDIYQKCIEKNYGHLYLPILSTGNTESDDINDYHQEQIERQSNIFINHRYKFIHYNGLHGKEIREKLNTLNSKFKDFDDRIIIVDEVHNLTSGLDTDDKSKLKYKLYEKLFLCKNSKFVLLSGTPIINDPIEIAYTCNLLRGKQYTYSAVLSGDLVTSDDILQIPAIDTYSINNNVLTFTLVDGNYSRDEHFITRNDNKEFSTTETLLTTVVNSISKMKDSDKNQLKFLPANKKTKNIINPNHEITIKNVTFKINNNFALPIDKKVFKRQFINKTESINSDMFMRRILGSVSFYENKDKSLFPEKLPSVTTLCSMSENQLTYYRNARLKEIRAANNAAKMNGMKSSEGSDKNVTSGTYKIFSRMACNFVFPDIIPRPVPRQTKDFFQFINELDVAQVDDSDTEGTAALHSIQEKETALIYKIYANDNKITNDPAIYADMKKAKQTRYESELKQALQDLFNKKDDYLIHNKTLLNQSPKYNAFITNLLEDGGEGEGGVEGEGEGEGKEKGKGKALVYSDFRKVEGLQTLGITLEANDWSELKVSFDTNGLPTITFDDKAKYLFAKYGDSEHKGNENQVLLNIYNWDSTRLAKKYPKIARQLHEFSIQEHTKKDQTITNEEVQSIGNLHGAYLKLLMITRSGAEGISLLNVRTVHILEPYWNNIRLDQVIGRANRMFSHSQLSPSERNFKVYYYMSHFSPANKIKVEQLITNKDTQKQTGPDGKLYSTVMTSDEAMKHIADKKSNIIKGFLSNLRNASVDCEIHKHTHNHIKLNCFSFKNKSPNTPAFSFDIDSEYAKKKINRAMVNGQTSFEITFHNLEGHNEALNGNSYIYIMDSGRLHDIDTKQYVGTMKLTADKMYKVEIIK